MMMNLIIKKIILTAGMLFLSMSALSENPGLDIEGDFSQQWLSELLMGKDLSHKSEAYAQGIQRQNKANSPTINNPLTSYQFSKQRFVDLMNRTLQQKTLNSKHQDYIEFHYQQFKPQHRQTLNWLKGIKTRLSQSDISQEKLNQIDQLYADIKAEAGAFDKLIETDIHEWSTLTKSVWKLINANNNLKYTSDSPKSNILRNLSLPYSQLNTTAPELTYEPAITPSYHNQHATPGGVAAMQADDMVQLTPEINQLAAELDYDYIRIYNFVRQQVTEQLYTGGMKGSQGTLLSMAGNDVDQAALLIALLRSSQVPAQFVQGIIELPVEKVAASMGLENASKVMLALDRAGIAYEPVVQGGQVRAIRRFYTWVSAYIPYGHYRGSFNSSNDPAWIPLVPGFKQYEVVASEFNYLETGLNTEDIISDYYSEQAGNTSPINIWQEQLNQAVTDNELNFDGTSIQNITQTLSLLPASLPFEVVVTQYEGVVLPNNQLHQLTINLKHEGVDVLDTVVPMPAIAGKNLSLSYRPASVDDMNVINQMGGMALVPPYLVDLKPVLTINGKVQNNVASAIGMSQNQELTIGLQFPGGEVIVNRQLMAGTYLNIITGTQNDYYPIKEDLDTVSGTETKASRLMHNLGLNYFKKWSEAEDALSHAMDMTVIRALPSLVLITPEYTLDTYQGLPVQMSFKGISMDAMSRTVDVISRNQTPAIDWMKLAAIQGSWLEADIFKGQWQIQAVSSDTILKAQQSVGETIHEITQGNISQVLPGINTQSQIKDHISQFVQQGFHAQIATNPYTQDSWQGHGWHIWHPDSGASGYFISGDYAGGQTTEPPENWISDDIRQLLMAPYGQGVNNDPLSARNIIKIVSTDNQIGVVNQMLPKPTQVLVTDAQNRPVVNALVRFEMKTDQAELQTNTGFANNLETYTNDYGIAEADVKLDKKMHTGYSVRLDPADVNKTLLGLAEISASLQTDLGEIQLQKSFNHYALPDSPTNLIVVDCNWNSDEECDEYGGTQETYSGSIHVIVLDQYDNSVPNIPIQVSAEQAIPRAKNTTNKQYQFQDNKIQISGKSNVILTSKQQIFDMSYKSDALFEGTKRTNMGSCFQETRAKIAANMCYTNNELMVPECAKNADTILSKNGWSTFGIYNGRGYEGTKFPVRISVAGLKDKYVNRINYGPYGRFLFGQDYNGPYGDYFAAKPVTSAYKKLEFFKFEYDYFPFPISTCDYYHFYINSIKAQTTESIFGNATITLPDPLDNMYVEYAMGATASFNFNHLVNDTVNFDGAPGYQEFTFLLNSYTVTAEVINRSPEEFVLNDDSTTAVATYFDVLISPDTYRPKSLTAFFYADNEIISTSKINHPSESLNEVMFPAGIKIDPAKEYSMEVVLNKDTDVEIIYNKQPLEGINRRLVSAVNCDNNSGLAGDCGGPVINGQFDRPIQLSTNVDLANAAVCRQQGFNINMTTDARVTIEAFQHDLNGTPGEESIIVADNESMTTGINAVAAQAETFRNHNYTLKITATDDVTGEVEEVYGLLTSQYDLNNALPIGHAVVKGVDLADGSMVYSKKDISLVAPGADLEFIRTYSSQGRHDMGALGYGWVHNYLSRVIVDNCGGVTVTGSDAGSARFKIQGDEFIPLKGYHSSLVLNDDGSFDFFPKGGLRYHYVKMQDKVWWMSYVEDPSGNRLTVNLEPRAGAPIIRSVTDSVGRTLNFTYTLKSFGLLSSEMLTKVKGPGGINLTFDYDAVGNLVKAQREGDSTDEVMTYSGDLTGPSRSLLLSVKDQPRNSTRSWTYREQSINPSGLSIPTIASIEVASISETDAGSTNFSYSSGNAYNSSAQVNQNSQITHYTLNDYGAATQITSPAGTRTFDWNTDTDVLLMSETDENNRLRSFEYDDYGNVTQERIGSLISTYTYESPQAFDPPYIKDRIKTHTNWRGDQTLYNYDSAGRKTKEILAGTSTEYSYNSKGLVNFITDGRGLTTSLTYDGFGYQKSITNPESISTYSSYNARGQKLTETDGNGHVTTFDYDTSDRVTQKQLGQRIWTTVYENGGRKRTETDPLNHSTVYQYDAQGRLLSTTNADSDIMSYSYDDNGNKLSETDFGGHTTTFSYNNANRLITKSEPLGKMTTYTYDNVGNVLTETTADRVTEYGYDPNRYFQTSITRKAGSGDAVITRTVDGHGNILTETDPNGNETTFTYDAHDRLLTESGPSGSGRVLTYDGNGNIESETILNSTGNQVTTHSYDLANRLSQSTLPEGGIISYSYDGNDNIIVETKPNGYQATYSYNNLNLPTSKQFASGSGSLVWNLDYDNAGNLISEDGPHGQAITYTYDALNREETKTDVIGLVKATTYDADSNVETETDGNGTLITHTYNALHQRTKTTKPLGRSHDYTYTLFGELETDTGPNGTITHTINKLGRKVESQGPDDFNVLFGYDRNGNLTSETDSKGITTTHVINALNQTTSSTRSGFTQIFTYDTVGNLLTETDYRGIVTEHSYDLENRRTETKRAGVRQQSTTFNKAGLPVIVKDANGNNTVHEYNGQYHKTRTIMPENQVIVFTPNAYGDVVAQDNPGPNDIIRTYDERRRLTSETNGAGETTLYEYDGNNNRTAVIKPEGNALEYDFDVANRLTEVTNVPEAITTSYAYDSADNLKTITDAESKVTTFAYDNRNRKTSKTYPDDAVESYTYDAVGNLKTVDLANGDNYTYTYDDLNRQIKQEHVSSGATITVDFTLDGNGNIKTVTENIDGQGSSITADFDDWDRLTLITDHHGNNLQFDYDNNGNRTILQDPKNTQSSYVYDDLSRLSQAVVAGTGAFDYIYNSAGLLDGIKYPNQGQANFIYDDANRIDVITHTQMGVPVAIYDYDYDDNGNRVQLTRTNINTSEIITYNYDNADRMRQVTYPNQTVDYMLDKVGNRVTESVDNGTAVITKTYTHNNRDQITNITDTAGLNVTYDYDATGNRTMRNKNGVITTFDYTSRQRIKSITENGNTINYKYDYMGNRIEKTSNGQTSLYTYDGTSLLYETNTIGNVIAKYHYGSDRILAETRSGTNQYLFHDALRTPIAITNQDGSIQNRIEYDAWGNRTDQTATDENPFGFTGYQEDSDTGLYFAKARYYDPVEGVFLREDPLLGDINMPPSLHRYNYAANNPTYYIDPTGKAQEPGHFYGKYFEARAAGFSVDDSFAIAFYSQGPDEHSDLDAFSNTINFQVFTPSGNEYTRSNNAAQHGLTGLPVTVMLNATEDYLLNVANSLSDVGSVGHARTDAGAFHFPKDQVSLPVEERVNFDDFFGHGLSEGHSTDNSLLYPTKVSEAFYDGTNQLYKYGTKHGLVEKDDEAFNKRVKYYSKLYFSVSDKVKERALIPTKVRKFTRRGQNYFSNIYPVKEDLHYEELHKIFDADTNNRFSNFRPEQHSASANWDEYLETLSVSQLRNLLELPMPASNSNRFSRDLLVDFIERRALNSSRNVRKFNMRRIEDVRKSQREERKALIKESKTKAGVGYWYFQ